MNVDDIIRRGTITEIVGRLSSGRTSLLLACLRRCLARGGAAALVDADGAFDPESAEAAGIDVRRVLWVRCAGRRDIALRATDLLVRCPGFAVVVLDVGETPPFISLSTAFGPCPSRRLPPHWFGRPRDEPAGRVGDDPSENWEFRQPSRKEGKR